MKSLFVWLNRIIRKHKAMKRWQRIVTVLAAIMTFVTTYALILPAITVEKNTAEDVGGMYLDAAEDPVLQPDEALDENALLPVAVRIAADQDNAVTFLYEDEEMSAVAVISTEEEIPEGAELVVNYVVPESEMYEDLDSRAALLAEKSVSEIKTCAFYDFALVCDGVDVTPKTGLADIRVYFYNNTVEHYDEVIYGGKFGLKKDVEENPTEEEEDGLVMVSTDQEEDTPDYEEDETDPAPEINREIIAGDALIEVNSDDSSVVELVDGIVTTLTIKGLDLESDDSVVGLIAGPIQEESVNEDEDSPVPEESTTPKEPRVLTVAEKDYTVKVTCDPESGVPDEALLKVYEISKNSKEYQRYLEETKKAMGLSEEENLPLLVARFFDIKIMVGGEEFKPASGVTVEIAYPEKLAEEEEMEVNALHFADGTSKPDVIEANVTEISEDGTSNVEFTAETFSVYGVVYTVDFHYSVNGKEFNFSIPGGGYVSMSQLVEVLGLAADDEQSESVETADPQAQAMFSLEDVKVSKKTRAFVEAIKQVEFSNRELVWVGKVNADSTVGRLKETNKLECKYSAELTEENIKEIDSSIVESGDWALIGMQPFDTKESLTVTMKNGDQFVVRVTDAQISASVLTADGKTFVITVNFDAAAEIPAGTKLVAEEIEPGTDEYLQYLGRTWAEVNKEYLAQKKEKKHGANGPDDIMDIRPVNLDRTRFFDVAFVCGGKEIEPKAPVQVDIQLAEGLSIDADAPITGVVHFPKATDPDGEKEPDAEKTEKTEIELIKNFKSVADENGSIVEYTCELDSFSALGAYLGQETKEAGFTSEDLGFDLPKLAALRAGESASGLKDLEASKKLTPNTLENNPNQKDGTYTLSLSVKGDAVESEQITKANVLIVMDRSTSMRTVMDGAAIPYTGTTYNQGTTYYGIVDDEEVTLIYQNNRTLAYRTEDENGQSVTYPYEGTVYVSGTRLQAEQAALDTLISRLTEKNTQDNPDIIEVQVASFASVAGDELEGAPAAYSGTVHNNERYSSSTESNWLTSYDANGGLYKAVHDNSINNGTNWEAALIYAKELADAKKQEPGQEDEDVYIIFMTDGVPTCFYGESSKLNSGWGAWHYVEDDGTDHGYVTIDGERVNGGEVSYLFARDGSACTINVREAITNHNTYNFPNPTNLATTVLENRKTGGVAYPAQTMVEEDGYKLYNIFTFNEKEASTGYLRRLTNFAYGVGDTAEETPTTDEFYKNASNVASLRNAFDNIFKSINDKLAHGDVKIVDGLSTNAMTTNIKDGEADGIRYKVTDETGKVVYTVTATGDSADPEVTFKVGNNEYTYKPSDTNNKVHKVSKYTSEPTVTYDEATGKFTKTEVVTTVDVGEGKTIVQTNTIVRTSDDGEEYTFVSDTASQPEKYNTENAVDIPEDAQSYYSLDLGGIEYRMALASSVTTPAASGEGEGGEGGQGEGGEGEGGDDEVDKTRTLTWDLSPIGALHGGWTYTMELVVWPNQEAYDYVAGLNNFPDVPDDEFEWDEDLAEDVCDDDGNLLYSKGGVAKYSSIVRYDNGDGTYTYAVLSNTRQDVYYSDVHSQSTNDVITSEDKVEHYDELNPPNPMELTFTDTFLEKEWGVDRNPALLAQFLFRLNEEGEIEPTKFHADFYIYQGNSYKTDEDAKPYKIIPLGWNEETEEYDWDEGSERWVTYEGKRIRIGTRWSNEFAIATGLMLSDVNHIISLGLDPDDYATATYNGKTYYILEKGHDYNVEEVSELGYEFDFISPSFHPMLVDGKLMNVVFDGGIGEEKLKPTDHFVVTSITPAPGGSGKLLIANKLRAYINIEKLVVDKDGKTPLPEDDTIFKYMIDLQSPLNPGPFEGTHVPWFGINDLHYHTEDEETGDYTYYQANVTNSDTRESHTLTLKTETGEVYEAVCTDEAGNEYNEDDEPYLFHEDYVGPYYITYYRVVEAEDEGGEGEGGEGGQGEGGEGDDEEEEPVLERVTLLLYGNELEQEKITDSETGEVTLSTNHVFGELQIRQGQKLSIVNVPQDTRYTVTELLPTSEYDIVSIRREILNGTDVESRKVFKNTNEVSGTVVPDRDNNLIFTNKVHSTDITVRKTTLGNQLLAGAVFKLQRTQKPADVGESEYDGDGVSLPGEDDTDTGVYDFNNLPDGEYKLTEIVAPGGYQIIGGGTVATFTVTHGQITNVTESQNVYWNDDTLTFVVKDTVEPNTFTVRKEWRDFDGELTDAEQASVTVLLKRRKTPPTDRYLTVTVNTSNGRASKTSAPFKIEKDAVTVRWDDNSQFWYNSGRIAAPVVSPLVFTDRTNHNQGQAGNNLDAIWEISNLGDVTGDVEVTFTYNMVHGPNDDWFYNRISNTTNYPIRIANVASSEDVSFGGGAPEPDTGFGQNGKEELVLTKTNHWAITKTIGGSDNNYRSLGYDYPATDNAGNPYYYYIEEDLPEGADSLPGYQPPTYTGNLNPGDVVGIQTVTNKETERGSLAVQKLVTIAGSSNSDMTPANGKYNFTVKDSNDNIVRYVQIRMHNGTVTYKTSKTAIDDNDNEGFIRVYAEGAIVDDLPLGTYTVTETDHELDSSGYDMQLVDIKVNGENEFNLSEGTATLTVTASDENVPTATSSYTNMLIPLTDIPLTKTWSWSDVDQEHFDGREIVRWSATFNLQYREVYVSGEPDSPENVQSIWGYVKEGGSTKQITISSEDAQGNVADTATNTFAGLPQYKRHANGSIYQLKYAVEEASYRIEYKTGDPTVWTKGSNGAFEEHYAPAYDEDATQAGESISITNAPTETREQKAIDLGLQKMWEDEDGNVSSEPPDDSYYAKFKLKRYYHEEYLELDHPDTLNLVKLTLDLGNETKYELEVPKGSPVYFTADLKTECEGLELVFRKVLPEEEPADTCTLLYPNPNHYASTDSVISFVVSDGEPIILNDNETWEFVPELSSPEAVINEYVLGGIDGVRLATFDSDGNNHGQSHDFPYDVTGEIHDPDFEEEFTLNSVNEWAKNFKELPQIVEKLTVVGNKTFLTTMVYSYYFEEIECNPPEYYAVFRNHNNSEVRYGDELSRVEISGLTIDAINKPSPETLIYKVDEKDLNQTNLEDHLLPGAQFTIVKYVTDEFQQRDGSWGDDGAKVAVLTEDGKDGKFTVEGLPIGFYEILETDHPTGYIRAEQNPRFKVVLDAESERLVIEALNDDAIVRVHNNYKDTGDNVFVYGNTPGAALPHTGGLGTKFFYLIGTVLTVLAGVGFLVKRKMLYKL